MHLAFAVASCAVLLVIQSAGIARGDEDAKAKPHAAQVREALTAFGRSYRSKKPAERAKAVRVLGALKDKKVVKRLLKCTTSEKDADVLRAVFEALGAQTESKAQIVPKLAKHLEDEVAVERKRIAKRDCGLLVDPATGDIDDHSEAGKARLDVVRRRGEMLAALLGTLATLEWPVAKKPLDLTPLLLDASNDLVVAVLARMGKAKDWAALPEVLLLYRMYPVEGIWETGEINNALGTPEQAKADWMVRYGHPDKQRKRPEVVVAIRAMLLAVTGKDFDSPEALAEYLETPEVQKRLPKR